MTGMFASLCIGGCPLCSYEMPAIHFFGLSFSGVHRDLAEDKDVKDGPTGHTVRLHFEDSCFNISLARCVILLILSDAGIPGELET